MLQEMDTTLKEWAPLSDVFSKLPVKVQSGLFTQNLNLTCLDVLPEFLALGTNFGLVYWYDRRKRDMQKLRCENASSPITAVKITSTVDYMVACGNADGNINIFQIPKSHPESLPESLKPKNKQVERYTVSELHDTSISALEWAKNGMKLFSGDKNGHIVLTEIDFYMHLCKSVEIINESYEVVQLSYYQQLLLVSTTYRSIICKKEDKWKVSQVGKKDRKVLGLYGGVFYQYGLRPTDILLYCTRPGLRIWISDINGTVQQTLLFKDILNQEYPEVPLINPISGNLKQLRPQREACFGILLPFNDELLVTYSNDVVYVLNPKDLTILSTVSHLRRVLWVAAHKDEIFILEGERSIIRLSYSPELARNSTTTIPTATNFLPLSTSIKDLTNKFQTGSIISAIPPFIESAFTNECDIHTDSTSIIKAEEAIETPKQSSPKLSSSNTHFGVRDSVLVEKITEIHKKLEIYNKIAVQDYDDNILYQHKRRKKRSDMSGSIASWSSNSSDEKEASISKPTLMNVSTVGVLPDLRSPESIKHDIESKEKILADVLCFTNIKIPAKDLDGCDNRLHGSKPKANFLATEKTPIPIEKTINKTRQLNSEFNITNFYIDKQNKTPLKFSVTTATEQNSRSDMNPSNLNGLMENIQPRPCMYGPPSASSNPNSILDIPECHSIPYDWQLKTVAMADEPSEFISDNNSLADWEII